MSDITTAPGVPEAQRDRAATLYLEAFGPKLAVVLGRDNRVHGFISDILDPDFAISAVDTDGQLLGIAGFKTEQGSFVGGTLSQLARHYGWLTAIPRGLILGFLERDIDDKSLLMDGICVSAEARGRGIGSRLLDAICEHARGMNLSEVRLDVIDTNPRARALYQRIGFEAGTTSHLGPLRHIFGFRAATTMRLALTGAGGIDAPVFNTHRK